MAPALGVQQAARRRVVTGWAHVSTYETEIIFAALMLGVNWTVFTAVVDDDAYAAVRGVELSKARFWLPVVGFLSIVFSWIVIGAVYLVLVMLAPVSDTNLPAFVRSSSVTNCLLIPNVFLLLMFYASSFFFALAVCVASDSGIMLGLSALMFALMVVMLQALLRRSIEYCHQRGLLLRCAGDRAAGPRKVLRRRGRRGLPKEGVGDGSEARQASGLMFSPAPPSALEELYSGENPAGGNAVRRRRARRVFGMKKRGPCRPSTGHQVGQPHFATIHEAARLHRLFTGT